MNRTIIISSNVIDRIQSLSDSDRIAVAGAIAHELILGKSIEGKLTPMETILYHMIRSYVRHDSRMA